MSCTHDERWSNGLEHLQEFAARNGHCAVPSRHVCEDGYLLGEWVRRQRRGVLKSGMEKKRRRQLEAIPGWTAAPLRDSWDRSFTELTDFLRTHGHSSPPIGFRTPAGNALGRWVSTQRRAQQRGELAPLRAKRLAALPGWKWSSSRTARWERMLGLFTEYARVHRDTTIPRGFITAEGEALGEWIHRQHRSRDAGTLSADRCRRIDAVFRRYGPAIETDRSLAA